MSNLEQYSDEHFRQFALSLESSIADCKAKDPQPFLKRQKAQVELLVQLEKDFKLALIAHSTGVKVYKQFISFICDEQRNILAARPYFRERQGVFTKQISQALRKRSERALFRFHFNYRFIQFVMASQPWAPKSKLARLAKKIIAVRGDLVTMNMPLAISRAKIFFKRTQKSHLSYMDLIQIACEGLMSGIDKFVPPYSRAFRGVAIGRMTGNFIEQYSETLVHFYPVDKRKIYRANKLAGRQTGQLDFDEVAAHVNKGAEPIHQTTSSEISNLMAAASTVSADAVLTRDEDDEAVRVTDRFAAPASCQPDVQSELHEAQNLMTISMATLSAFDRKILRLSGVQ